MTAPLDHTEIALSHLHKTIQRDTDDPQLQATLALVHATLAVAQQLASLDTELAAITSELSSISGELGLGFAK